MDKGSLADLRRWGESNILSTGYCLPFSDKTMSYHIYHIYCICIHWPDKSYACWVFVLQSSLSLNRVIIHPATSAAQNGHDKSIRHRFQVMTQTFNKRKLFSCWSIMKVLTRLKHDYQYIGCGFGNCRNINWSRLQVPTGNLKEYMIYMYIYIWHDVYIYTDIFR